MHSSFFLAGDVIVEHTTVADRLLLVVSGSVKILLPGYIHTYIYIYNTYIILPFQMMGAEMTRVAAPPTPKQEWAGKKNMGGR